MSACIPCSSAILAIWIAFFDSSLHPVRIFRVTGISTEVTTERSIDATSGSSLSNADPAAALHTFLAGQPILISIISAPRAALSLAASAISDGSVPAICTALGASSPM